MSERDDLAAVLHRHGYSHQYRCECGEPLPSGGLSLAQHQANVVLTAGWQPFARQAGIVRAERDALAATVQRVRERLDEPMRDSERSHWLNRWGVGFDAGWDAAMAFVRNALIAPSDPATEEASDD